MSPPILLSTVFVYDSVVKVKKGKLLCNKITYDKWDFH